MSDRVEYTELNIPGDGYYMDGDDGSRWKYQGDEVWVMVRPPIPTTTGDPWAAMHAQQDLGNRLAEVLGIETFGGDAAEPHIGDALLAAIEALKASKVERIRDTQAVYVNGWIAGITDATKLVAGEPIAHAGPKGADEWNELVRRIKALKADHPDDLEVIYATPIRDDVWAGNTENEARIGAMIGDLVPVVDGDSSPNFITIEHPDARIPIRSQRRSWRICKVPEKNDE